MYFGEIYTVDVKLIVICVVTIMQVSVELCYIYRYLNFGITSVGTECIFVLCASLYFDSRAAVHR